MTPEEGRGHPQEPAYSESRDAVPEGREDPYLDWWLVLSVLVGRWRTMAGVCAVTFLVGLLLLVVAMPSDRYSSSASFLPADVDTPTGGLAGIAAQFGVQTTATQGLGSPRFYAELLDTRAVLSGLLEEKYTVRTDTGVVTADLGNYMLDRWDTEAKSGRAALVDHLRDDVITVSVGRETGIVALKVSAPHPELAAEIARRILTRLQEYDVRIRQSRATAEREFVEARLSAVRDQLQEVEGELQRFLEGNRDFRDSPQLLFQYERLQRSVALRQQVATSLAQALEQARIEEVRSTPGIVIIEEPDIPLRPESRRTARNLVILLLLAIVLSLAAALLQAALEHAARDPRSGYWVLRRTLKRVRRDFVEALRWRWG